MSVLNAPHFQDDNKAREYLEAIRWPNGPVCPHCGVVGDHYQLQGKAHRPGLWKCKDCRQQFSVTVGTVFERSKIPLSKWLQAVYLMVSSKKGISSHQLHRMLGVTYKSAWFMSHRIREAMRDGDLSPFGSGGGAVEVDETFIGNDRTIKPKHSKKGRGYHHKHKVLALVDRTTGDACTHQTRNCHDGRDRFIAQRAHTTVVVQRCNDASSENLVSWVTAWKILGGSESFL